MLNSPSEKSLSDQSMEELLETAARLKLDLLRSIQKSDQVTAELFIRARRNVERD